MSANQGPPELLREGMPFANTTFKLDTNNTPRPPSWWDTR
eukprot:COSAG06_NODE_21_length_33796_cov_70.184853_28_plen_40_part_00